MKGIWKNLKIVQKIGLIVGFLILVGVIIAVIVIKNNEIKVNIEFETKVNIPNAEIVKIREKMVKVIQNNTADFDSGVTYVGIARDYEESEIDDLSMATFVVDFDSIKESYMVNVTWPDPDDGSPNIIISCPIFDSKYPETPCATEANSSSDITNYLPHTGTLASGEKYKVIGEYSDGDLYLEIKTNGDANEAVAATKKWISSLGLNPNDYLIFAPAGQYIQANNAETNDANVNKNLPYFMPGVYNVSPVVDSNGNVTSIQANIAGCTDAQTDPVEEDVREYLTNKGIGYPVTFEYCVE